VDGVEVAIDGNVATLIDLSIIGAQVVSQTILKPNQRVRMSIGDTSRPVRFGAARRVGIVRARENGPSLPRRHRVLRRGRGRAPPVLRRKKKTAA
jgi:hypothetical protein